MKRTRKYYVLAGIGALPVALLTVASMGRLNPYFSILLCNSTVFLFLCAGYQLGARTNKETYESADLRKLFSWSDDEISKDK